MKNARLSTNVFFRYINAGIISVIFELVLLYILNNLFNISATLSVTIAFWLTLFVSFGLQKIFAFQNYQKTKKILSSQIIIFSTLVIFNYLFTLFVVGLFPENMLIISRLTSLFFITIWNYYIYKKLFGKKSKKDQDIINLMKKIDFRKLGKKIMFSALLTIPIFAFMYQYLSTGNKIIGGDFDYYAHLYEAFRINVQEYGQFPSWDPWLSGGIPLFNNPQFGLFSIQSVLVLLFGTIYGLKLAYVVYSLAGFWGMYVLGRKVLLASKIRSMLGGYLWVFCGFFAAHNMSHYTFALFFLIPWIFVFLAKRHRKWSWVGLGLLIGLIALSSLHYAFLMCSLSVGIFFGATWLVSYRKGSWQKFKKLLVFDIKFIGKAILVAITVSGYRIITTYAYLSSNVRPEGITFETPPGILTMLKAIFLPYDTLLEPPKTHWGWWEYDSYLGIGFSIAVVFCVAFLIFKIIRREKIKYLIASPKFLAAIVLLGLTAFLFSLGEFTKFSPYSFLKQLPGFTETRVSSRWIIFISFSLIVFVMSWKKHKYIINGLLVVAIVELFVSYGPPRLTGGHFFSVNNDAAKLGNFKQYDNGYKHEVTPSTIEQSYFYSTSRNIGQIYGDDSIVNTLNKVLGTKRCGLNLDPECDLVLSNNADITYWSPNRVELTRTGPGEIKLNMNRDKGWRVNDTYIFRGLGMLDPNVDFILPIGADKYSLIYSPKLSPTWILWRTNKIFY
jgi:putative flippase GtrA